MKRSLLQFLECPKCHGEYSVHEVVEEQGQEIMTGSIQCNCSVVPIVRGVARFVSEESYSDCFGYEWKQFFKTQFDSHTGLTHTQKTFEDKTTWTQDKLGPNDVILEIGCGAGRFLDIAAANSGATVIGLDLSQAVDVSMDNVGHWPNVHIVQADAYEMPFKPEIFTKIFTIGVLHVTPSTHEAFKRCLPFLAPGGEVAVWVYRKFFAFKLPNLTEPIRKMITCKMPFDKLMNFCRFLDKYWYPVVKLIKIGGRYPLRGLLYCGVFPHSSDWRVLNSFDCYSPRYTFFHTGPEMRKWFTDAGLEDVKSLSEPTAVYGRRPAKPVPLRAVEEQRAALKTG